MTLLAHVGENGSYLRDVLPGMLVAGVGLGVAVVSVSIADPHRRPRGGDRDDLRASTRPATRSAARSGSRSSRRSRLEAAPSLARRQPSGIAHAFVAAGLLASVASLVALAVLPRARHFVPKLRLNPSAMPTH